MDQEQTQRECKLELPKCASKAGFVWPCNPNPDKAETGQWLEFLAANPCTCNPENIDHCICACTLDSEKHPRLVAMVRGNASYFKIRPESLEDTKFPMRLVYKCIHTAELMQLTERVNESMQEFQKLGSFEGVMSMYRMLTALTENNDDSGDNSESGEPESWTSSDSDNGKE